nr:hypothetical protein [uncultured Pedobacter sp.]
MTTIIAHIPESSRMKVKKFIEELGGEILSKKEFTKLSVLKEMEEGFMEAKEIEKGTREGFSLKEIISGE